VGNPKHPADFISEGIKYQSGPDKSGPLVNAFIQGNRMSAYRSQARQKAFADLYDVDVSKLGLKHNYTTTQVRKAVSAYINQVELDRKQYGDREAMNRAASTKAELQTELSLISSDDSQFTNMVEGYTKSGLVTAGFDKAMAIANNANATQADLAKLHNPNAGFVVGTDGHFVATQHKPFDYDEYATSYQKRVERIGPIKLNPTVVDGKTYYSPSGTYSLNDANKKVAIDNLLRDDNWVRWFRGFEAEDAIRAGYDITNKDPKKAKDALRKYLWDEKLDPRITIEGKKETLMEADDGSGTNSGINTYGKYVAIGPTTETITVNNILGPISADTVELTDYVTLDTPNTEKDNVASTYNIKSGFHQDGLLQMKPGNYTAAIAGIGRATINGKDGIWAVMAVPRERVGSVSVKNIDARNSGLSLFATESESRWVDPKYIFVPYEDVRSDIAAQTSDLKSGKHFDYYQAVPGHQGTSTAPAAAPIGTSAAPTTGAPGAQAAVAKQTKGTSTAPPAAAAPGTPAALRNKASNLWGLIPPAGGATPPAGTNGIGVPGKAGAAMKKAGAPGLPSAKYIQYSNPGEPGEKGPGAGKVYPADVDTTKIEQLLFFDEGKEYKVYPDSKEIPTVGIGFNLNREDAKAKVTALGVDFNKLKAGKVSLTDAQIEKLFKDDIAWATQAASSHFTNFDKLSDTRKAALINLSFNLGETRLRKFNGTRDAIAMGDFELAAKRLEATQWYKDVPVRAKRIVALIRNG